MLAVFVPRSVIIYYSKLSQEFHTCFFNWSKKSGGAKRIVALPLRTTVFCSFTHSVEHIIVGGVWRA